jgi:anti-sigma B factor antagonist
MNISTENRDNTWILSVSGVIDATNSSRLEEAVITYGKEPARGIILDLHNLTYMSSAGIREIIKARRLLDSKKMFLAFCSLQPFLQEVLDLAGLTDRLLIYKDIESAISAQIP